MQQDSHDQHFIECTYARMGWYVLVCHLSRQLPQSIFNCRSSALQCQVMISCMFTDLVTNTGADCIVLPPLWIWWSSVPTRNWDDIIIPSAGRYTQGTWMSPDDSHNQYFILGWPCNVVTWLLCLSPIFLVLIFFCTCDSGKDFTVSTAYTVFFWAVMLPVFPNQSTYCFNFSSGATYWDHKLIELT